MLKARRVQTWAHPGFPFTLLTGGLPHFVPVSFTSSGRNSAARGLFARVSRTSWRGVGAPDGDLQHPHQRSPTVVVESPGSSFVIEARR
jgi:hypothetical protein